ncbi:TetR/AcrR family transcriptional regulator [Adlercreutzia equolifaciens]|uniref:TetR/AcrR family transcriptional regulator n=1 Tax=Adlercreutzia equolifaciens TaxID=446660 RepID=UPI003AEF67CA
MADQTTVEYREFRKQRIVEATERALEHISFEDLTVTIICDEANISRPTFYRYFQDKFEIAQWLWNQAGEKYLRECGRSLGWYESNLLMMRNFLEHQVFFSAANASDIDFNACINHGYRKRVEYLEEVIRERSPLLLTDDVRFQITFFTDAESRAIAAWGERGMKTPPEVVARRIEQCVPPRLHSIIEDAHRQASPLTRPQ